MSNGFFTPQGSAQGSANGSNVNGSTTAGRGRHTHKEKTYNVNFGPKNGGGGGQQSAGGIGQQQGGRGGGRGGSSYSPLADPEFFTNADVRNYCEAARAAFIQLSFDIAMAAEVLNAVLKEVPDPEGRAFGSKLRARRVSKHLAKTADDAKDAAKRAAAAYAAFQREFSPEMQHNPRARQAPRRSFDFNG